MESKIDIVADIGGTYARFAQVTEGAITTRPELRHILTFNNDEFSGIEALIDTYLQSCRQYGSAPEVGHVCLAVAGPVDSDRVRLVNRDWSFSRSALTSALNVRLHVLNDFSAQGWWLRDMDSSDVEWLRPPQSERDAGASRHSCMTVAGPGTGFGSATLTAGDEVLESEPGHCAFAPTDLHEARLLEALWQHFPRVSVEHLLSGPGLANLFMAHSQLAGKAASYPEPAAIAGAARDKAHPDFVVASAVLRDFSAILGAVSGDIVLSFGSQEGFFLSGALIRKLDSLFDRSLFMQRFCDKGPFSGWISGVPVGILTAEHPGLLGCASYIRRIYQLEQSRDSG
jgi:glucokinase